MRLFVRQGVQEHAYHSVTVIQMSVQNVRASQLKNQPTKEALPSATHTKYYRQNPAFYLKPCRAT